MVEQTYDIHESYSVNYEQGPVFASPHPGRHDNGERVFFLGLPVRSRIGIAAGLLLNSKWVAGYARRGFDLLTYKTVRSGYRPCYPPPNWVFVCEGADGICTVLDDCELPADPRELSSSVCFGMPSMAPEVWREDIARAKQALEDGQALIVSVVATPEKDWGAEELAEDFAQCARWAADAGADVIEANFSCPNVCSAEGSIYLDPELSHRIAKAIRGAIAGVPLLVKTGDFSDCGRLAAYLEALNGVANGVTMVNCLARPVLNRDGSPAFGADFRLAGVLGRAIHEPCVAAVRAASDIVSERGLALEVAAVGGVSRREDAAAFFSAGAQAVLLGSAPMYLPDIAGELAFESCQTHS